MHYKILGNRSLTSTPSEPFAFLRKIDLFVLSASLVTLFLALASEPWWSLTGSTTSNLLSIQVSPYFLSMTATGFPSSSPLANGLGSITRVIIFLGAIALLAASLKPTAWWRNLAVYFGLSSILELFLSFTLMYYWAQIALVGAYGIVPPAYGTHALAANIIGLDLRYYTAPLVTASFGLPYYLGFLGLGLIFGRSLIKIIQDRSIRVLASLLPGGGIHDVFLTPPFQHVWFSSEDQQFNPLVTDPDQKSDDELLVSFQRLYETVEPGGSLSVLLPESATPTADRLQRLMPNTGFTVESVGTIYRTAGRAEHELRFRKPEQATASLQTLQVVNNPDQPPVTEPVTEEPIGEIESPPVVEPGRQPTWALARMSHAERTMLKAAIEVITDRQSPIPYRELINHVYMELINKKIDFDSARNIENVLLDHTGRELILIEEPDLKTGNIDRKWWLGEQKLPEEHKGLPTLKILPTKKLKLTRPRLPRPGSIMKRVRKPRYKKRKTKDEDRANDSGYDTSSEYPVY